MPKYQVHCVLTASALVEIELGDEADPTIVGIKYTPVKLSVDSYPAGVSDRAFGHLLSQLSGHAIASQVVVKLHSDLLRDTPTLELTEPLLFNKPPPDGTVQ